MANKAMGKPSKLATKSYDLSKGYKVLATDNPQSNPKKAQNLKTANGPAVNEPKY